MLTVACCTAVVFCCTCILSFLDYFMALSERPDAFVGLTGLFAAVLVGC